MAQTARLPESRFKKALGRVGRILALALLVLVPAAVTATQMARHEADPVVMVVGYGAATDAGAPRAQEEAPEIQVLAPVLDEPEAKAEVPDRHRMLGPMDMNEAFEIVGWLEAAANAGKDRVVLEITSPGGYVRAGYAIAEAIDDAQGKGVRVACVADELAASAAFFVLQSCDERYMTKRTVLMTHSPYSQVEIILKDGDNQDLQDEIAYMRALALAWAEHCVAKMNISIDEYLEKIANGKAWNMAWREAKDVGAVDDVVRSVRDVK